ncbi:barstar family protein [Clostridium sp. SHJSY1]|uniref:barstar family protein n=1 Tax=Clostridium sp. SHJSY1 TaxID=2942483 RepID=UPI00287430CB|nr:barstar family protein [Clostridium sp. SHJSY1]MDS0524723.1 barstar family protein [Clostridium sp. SHJSY1]
MNKIILDGTKYTNKSELHAALKEKFKLPDYYGKNLDALWDCLTGDISLPINIEWINFDYSKEFLGDYAVETLNILFKASLIHKHNFKITVY